MTIILGMQNYGFGRQYTFNQIENLHISLTLRKGRDEDSKGI